MNLTRTVVAISGLVLAVAMIHPRPAESQQTGQLQARIQDLEALVTALQNQLATLQSDVTSQAAALQSELTSETTARQFGDSGLQRSIDGEVAARLASDEAAGGINRAYSASNRVEGSFSGFGPFPIVGVREVRAGVYTLSANVYVQYGGCFLCAGRPLIQCGFVASDGTYFYPRAALVSIPEGEVGTVSLVGSMYIAADNTDVTVACTNYLSDRTIENIRGDIVALKVDFLHFQ